MINLIQIFLVFRGHHYFDDSINFHRGGRGGGGGGKQRETMEAISKSGGRGEGGGGRRRFHRSNLFHRHLQNINAARFKHFYFDVDV